MTTQEDIQQLIERCLSIFAGLVRSEQDYSIEIQAKILLNKLHSKGVEIKIHYEGTEVEVLGKMVKLVPIHPSHESLIEE